ncbi:radical SAM protein [Paraburkholderia sp. BCC1876]|uniref:radical SAM protein n=1 Tax=Paraburkholderia sp. BCC1876 TaxID=2676303 RepID=UPI001591B653|nr:radical SAM protein [Paraburkholderia sp. BCC1876]
MIDCLIIGQSDADFDKHVRMLKFSFGADSGVYQDLDFAFVTYKGQHYRALEFINLVNRERIEHPLSNMDFLWPTIAVLGSFLHKHGLTFDYVNRYAYEKELLQDKLAQNRFRVIAITTTLYVTDAPIKEIISFIRRCGSDALIIVGGPHVKNRLAEVDFTLVDKEFHGVGADLFVNSAEGQMTLVNTIRCLRDGGALAGVKNLIWRKDLRPSVPAQRDDSLQTKPRGTGVVIPISGEETGWIGEHFVFNPVLVEDNPLEENPVDFSLFRREDMGEFYSLATAKSCPFACAFCCFPTRAGEYRYIDVPHVEQYLDNVRSLGIKTLTLLDDTFNVPKTRFKEILRMMIRNNYGLRWNSFYRSDQGDQETIELMAESGCEGVFLGIESASDEMLKKMNKTSRKKHYQTAVPLLKKHGIHTHANFIIGFPGETEATVKETLDFLEEYQPDTYKGQLWYADNKSPIWKRKDELNIKGIGFRWSHETMNSDEAARWLDYVFANVKGSVFLPEDGCGLWSVFYLQRHGMSKAQVHEFLQAFEAGIRLKRQDPSRQELPDFLVRRLFEAGTIPGSGPVNTKRMSTYAG